MPAFRYSIAFDEEPDNGRKPFSDCDEQPYFWTKITSETMTADGKTNWDICIRVTQNDTNTIKDTSETFDFDPKKPLELVKAVSKFIKSEEKKSCKDNNCD